MCRHLAYLGPPVSLATVLTDPPHSLLRQSWAPREMRGGGTINADGFGIGWYPGTDLDNGGPAPAPVRYRRDRPIWSDDGLTRLAEVTVTGAVLAAVRSATPGTPLAETACAPFTDGRWLFSHNGVVPGWPASMVDLARHLPVEDLLTLEAPIDSALLWALVRHRLRSGQDPAEAVGATVAEVRAAVPAARLNLLLTDGRRIVATTCVHSLSVRVGDNDVVVASEPTDDDPRWRQVPDGHLLTAERGRAEMRALDLFTSTSQPRAGAR